MRGALASGGKTYDIFRLEALAWKHQVEQLPFCLRVFLEDLLRHENGAWSTPLLSGGKHRLHKIQGIVAGFIPEVINRKVIDEIITMSALADGETARHAFSDSVRLLCRGLEWFFVDKPAIVCYNTCMRIYAYKQPVKADARSGGTI